MQKFSELPYTRPDIAAAVEQYKALSEALRGAGNLRAGARGVPRAEALETALSTAESLASIRNTMDTTDAFYDGKSRISTRTCRT